HDTSAALLSDGSIVGAVEEERFTRVKHTDSFPKHAINWLLSQANISLSDVDHIVLSFDIEKFKKNTQPFDIQLVIPFSVNI
ncbi:MAG: carbamoyltransferase N-terminal domain-containing protein, partial [Lentilactobacillus diolivorans]